MSSHKASEHTEALGAKNVSYPLVLCLSSEFWQHLEKSSMNWLRVPSVSWNLPLSFKSHCHLEAGCPFFILCALWWACCLLSLLWDALRWLTSLFSLQPFPSVSCRRDTPLTCLVRGLLSLTHTHSTTYFSPEQLPQSQYHTCVVIWATISSQVSCKPL